MRCGDTGSAEAMLDAVFEAVPACLAILDADLRYVRVNDLIARVNGIPKEAHLGRTVRDIAPSLASWLEPAIRAVLASGVPRVGRDMTLPDPGDPSAVRHWTGTLFPVRDASGRVTHVGACLADVTDRRAIERELRSLASQLTLAEERERRRIATELHDHVVQTLALAKLKAVSILAECPAARPADVDEVRSLLDGAIRMTRTLTFDLSPPMLHELGLVPTLKWLADRVLGRSGLLVSVDDDLGGTTLPADLLVLLFASARELLLNVARHARARQVAISATHRDGWVRVDVRDDGAGFVPESTLADGREGGFGLVGIRERVATFGGHLGLQSAPGAGTIASVVVPLGGHAVGAGREGGAR